MDNIQYKQKDGSSVLVPVFNGRTIDKMPELISQGRAPISVPGIMEQRVNAWNSNDNNLAKQWGNNYFDSGDSIIYHPDGRIKIVPDSQTLSNVNGNSPLRWSGSLVLPEGTFDGVDGVEFSKKDIKKFANKYLKQGEVLKNPIWQALARGDEALLKEYAGQVYSRINDSKLMKVWISPKSPDFEAERLWCLYGLGSVSNVNGDYDGRLVSSDGRLAGVAPEAQTCDEVGQNQRINLGALIGDINQARENGLIPPVLEKVFTKYNL